MEEPEYQLPEGRLLERKLAQSRRSARDLAAEVELSDSRIRHIIKGYQPVGGGQKVRVTGPADTLARIGQALGVTPDEFDQAGRSDAAHALADRLELDHIARSSPGNFYAADPDNLQIHEWLENRGTAPPPDSMLRQFDSSQLLDEMARRLQLADAIVEQQTTGGTVTSILGDALGNVDEPEQVAAHDDDIEAGQGHDEHA